MGIQQLFDANTAHLSSASRAWLSEHSTLNHAAAFHGVGDGSALSTLGAMRCGWFLYAPDNAPDYEMPADLVNIVNHARAAGCNYVLLDAEAPIIDGLPILDEDIADDFSQEGSEVDPQAEWRATAESEGWGIFESNGDIAEQIHLARDDEAGKFESDADAWQHVWDKSRSGSRPHISALTFLQENSPIEYADLVKFCE